MSAVGRLKGNHYVRSGPMIATESTKRKPGSLLSTYKRTLPEHADVLEMFPNVTFFCINKSLYILLFLYLEGHCMRKRA